ncbi:DUF4837 family protein [Gillisia hiemivivida]|uniref:DUF4837 family protein n=1 Tax=Gillisia hiemivivida TaxID=291190 RepID=A0A5C6ZXA3_9FLAO|nr:DUF4837 family protein [Gillisia hiemivivida]TXD95545.1 DUF4837 family protein [Gillisia hiemivivida]
MKNFVFLSLFISLLLTGCQDSESKNPILLATSSGNINNISVVIENEMWEGSVGEALRKSLASPVDGLPQEEPIFSLNQMPPEAFSGFVRKNRLFVKIEKGEAGRFKIFDDPFAHPQKGVVITGQDSDEIIEQINKNSEEIIKTLRNTEIKEKQRRINKSLKEDEKLKNTLGVSLKFPTAYRYAMENEEFFWLRKDIPKGNMEILVYAVPLNQIDRDTSVIANIIKMRDSIGKAYIHGGLEGRYMITEEAYAPYLFDSEIDGKFAYETKGTWEMKSAFMAGPFVNYAIRDSVNNRYIILEGFTFAPATAKRDNMFELEAILKSAKID